MNYADRVIIALDTDSFKEAENWVKTFGKHIKHFKVGSQLFTACGQDAVKMVHNAGCKVFLDLKFHDIPNTVSKSVESASKLGIWMLNVHASGGKKMMEAAGAALEGKGQEHRPIVIAVTVLTSLNQEELSAIGFNRDLNSQVEHLAKLAKDSGLDGVVASAHELTMIKKICGNDFLVVTPGIRPAWAASDDQSRMATPAEAFKDGADFIVIGRPLTKHRDPREACEKLLQELAIA